MTLTRKDVESIAHLARLQITEQEMPAYVASLSSIINFVEQLNRAQTGDVEPMAHPLAGDNPVNLIGNPIKFSETPVSYHRPPPILGEHTGEVLREMLEMDDRELDAFRQQKII